MKFAKSFYLLLLLKEEEVEKSLHEDLSDFEQVQAAVQDPPFVDAMDVRRNPLVNPMQFDDTYLICFCTD